MSSKNLSQEAKLAKNANIKKSMKETQERRSQQSAKVFELKIVKNKLSQKQHEALMRVFLEAKWLRNDMINHLKNNNSLDTYTITNIVQVRNKDKEFENRELLYLGSQMKQSVNKQINNDLKSLKKRKDNGYKVGYLKYCSDYRSIDLKQYGNTYRINKSKKAVKIQNIPGYVQVSGLEQLKDNFEYANAKLVNRASGYYLLITAYEYKKDIISDHVRNTVIGIDMGSKDHITLSDGTKINAMVEETDRLKRLQKKRSRQIKGSNNYRKTGSLIKKEYEKMDRRKNDLANKIVHDLLLNDYIFMQDENISAWKTRCGKRLQHSILGRVKSKLIRQDRVYVLKKNRATTKTCKCGYKNDIKLSDRTYVCMKCGYSNDRDIHAAQNMITMGVHDFKAKNCHNNTYTFIPVDRRDVKLVEKMSDWDNTMFENLSTCGKNIQHIIQQSSLKQEAAGSLVRQ